MLVFQLSPRRGPKDYLQQVTLCTAIWPAQSTEVGHSVSLGNSSSYVKEICVLVNKATYKEDWAQMNVVSGEISCQVRLGAALHLRNVSLLFLLKHHRPPPPPHLPKICHCEAKECVWKTRSFHGEGCGVSPHFSSGAERRMIAGERRELLNSPIVVMCLAFVFGVFIFCTS